MLSVIELAQLLKGALDEKFNITNKAAVAQVVSCLEAITITNESFQEISNTRMVKDLQALRQNKANDQILAKRIKNLLRKWKERLATTAPTIQSSQPNSPQNMSQGSSDTQFMTSQSQSPPISQLLPNHQRKVNGPTEFTNLLPKQPMNHHHLPAMTPPVPIHYQNGASMAGQESSSLLGKRKLDTSVDVDVNSNHSRKKMMKFKSTNLSAIPSPPAPPVVINNHQITQPMPTVVPPPQPPVVVEAPKKRGRKKGSKGIDSMLNGTIPDFQAEIRQKLALSTGKRNKTTMELQQMLESHQNTAMSWTNGDLDSSSLDRGFNSHPPLELSHASHGDEFHTKLKQEPEPATESLQSTSQSAIVPVRSLCIEEEIAMIRAQLPPIDFEAAALDIFEEYSVVDEDGEPVECTCTFREVITYLGDDDETSAGAAEVTQEPPKVDVAVVKNGASQKLEDSDEDETDDFCAVKTPSPSRGAVKSIFDPEYDANENLIEEMVRRKPRASKVIEVKIDKGAVKPMRIEPLLLAPEPVEQPERVPIINYVCDEDEKCPAREHFRRDAITNYDVERLHRSIVPGVNGFWNGIPEDDPVQDFSKDMENIDYEKHQLWKRVVPRYDFLTCDKIPNSFNDGSSVSIPPAPEPTDDARPSNGAKKKSDIEFREWHELMNVRSYNDNVLTILPYVIID